MKRNADTLDENPSEHYSEKRNINVEAEVNEIIYDIMYNGY